MPAPVPTRAASPEVAHWRRGAGPLTAADPWLGREWLTTDGLGGYASATIADVATRRFHGWLVAGVPGPDRRCVFLGRIDEVAVTGTAEVPLGAACWREPEAPIAPDLPRAFRALPGPEWEWRLPEGTLRRALRQPRGRAAVLVRWRWDGAVPLQLRLRPLLACRPYDGLTFANPHADATPRQGAAGALGFQPYPALPPLWFTGSASLPFRRDPAWWHGARYPADLARGYDGHEDLLVPGEWRLELPPGGELVLACAVGEPLAHPAEAFAAADATAAGRWRAALAANPDDVRAARLWFGADDFLYAAPGGRAGVLAGFPWFVEWGRDTFLALPGLLLARGDVAGCGALLAAALPFLRDGLLPNVYAATPAESHYGSADAALWFGRAVLLFDRAGGDPALLREQLWPALRSIAAAYRQGTGLGLEVDGEGLLCAGTPELNATWMDAQTSRGPVTPRHGQAVELNALWLSLLAHLAELQRRFGEPAAVSDTAEDHARAAAAFRRRFWLGDRLADRWHDGAADPTVRPNMVLAAALELSPLTPADRQAVVALARRELLTPRGLRTLSPADPAYQGRYQGGPDDRDSAYHQGTAWPWLLGAYVEAALRAVPAARWAAVQDELRLLLAPLLDEVDEAGLHHVSEVFDGDEPQRPGGTFAQAWNTGELLRARALLATSRGGKR